MAYSEPQTLKQDVEASKHTNYRCGIYLTVVGIPDAGGLHVVSLDENVQSAVITQLHFDRPTTQLYWEHRSVATEANPICHIHFLLKKQCRNVYHKHIVCNMS
jgi:hypothetical protein